MCSALPYTQRQDLRIAEKGSQHVMDPTGQGPRTNIQRDELASGGSVTLPSSPMCLEADAPICSFYLRVEHADVT